MERRKAITTAAAASLTLLAGAAGIALNSGIVGASGDDNVGQVSPVDSPSPSVVVYVDDPATRPAPTAQPSDSQPVGTSAASGYSDDGYDDDEDEHDSADRQEYEGGEDDD